MGSKKGVLPNDFRDFLSLLSLTGFIAIFLSFTFDITWLDENMTGIFLLLSGGAFLVIGKVYGLKKWLKDGIQQNEISQLIAIVFGFSSIVIGIMLIASVNIPIKISGLIGILALVPAIYTFVDYVAKNK